MYSAVGVPNDHELNVKKSAILATSAYLVFFDMK